MTLFWRALFAGRVSHMEFLRCVDYSRYRCALDTQKASAICSGTLTGGYLCCLMHYSHENKFIAGIKREDLQSARLLPASLQPAGCSLHLLPRVSRRVSSGEDARTSVTSSFRRVASLPSFDRLRTRSARQPCNVQTLPYSSSDLIVGPKTESDLAQARAN